MTVEIGARLTVQDRARFVRELGAGQDAVGRVGKQSEHLSSQSDVAARSLDRVADRRRVGAFNTLTHSLGRVGSALGGVVVAGARNTARGLGIAAVAVAAFGAHSVRAAGDAAETQSKFDTVFGASAGSVQKYVDSTSDRFGTYTKELEDAASTFGVFGQSAGVPAKQLGAFSTSLVQSGEDLASFYNTDPGSAFEDLRSGLAGEAEPLRKYGIFISDATMKAKALELGLGKGAVNVGMMHDAQAKVAIAQTELAQAQKKYGDSSVHAAKARLALHSAENKLNDTTKAGTVNLTESQKVMVRQKLIIGGLGKAQGDMARTQGSYANQTRAIGGRLKEVSGTIGKFLLPAFTRGATAVNRFLRVEVGRLKTDLPLLSKALSSGDMHAGATALDHIFGGTGRMVGPFEKVLTLARSAAGAVRTFVGQVRQVGAGRATANVVTQLFGPGGLEVLHAARDAIGAVARELQGGLSPAADSTSSITGALVDTLRFVTRHADLLVRALPYLAAGFVAFKVAQKASNAVAILAVPLRAGEIVSTVLLARANRQLAFQMGLVTGAQRTGLLTRLLTNTATTEGAVASSVAAGATGAQTGAQWSLNAAMTANPIGAVVVGLTLLAAGLVYVYKHSETFRNIVTGAVGAVTGALSAAFSWVKQNWPLLLAILTGPFGLAALAIARNFDTIQSAVKAAINLVIDGWNRLEFKIPGFDPPGPGPKFGGMTLGLPDIPRLAKGGAVSARLPYIVGDAGRPELFIPQVPGYVAPSIGAGASMLGNTAAEETGRGGLTWTGDLNVIVPNVDQLDDAGVGALTARVVDELDRRFGRR